VPLIQQSKNLNLARSESSKEQSFFSKNKQLEKQTDEERASFCVFGLHRLYDETK